MFSSYIKAGFDLCALLIKKFNDSFVYLGVKLRIVIGMLTLDIDIDHRLRKFNAAAFNIFMNSKDLTEAERCELIVKKKSLHILCMLWV